MSNFDVLEAYVSLRREVALIRSAAIKNLEFGHNQIAFLYRLSLSGATMGELADFALTDKASTTRTVALLETAGLVRRITDKNDRRVVNIELTAAGRSQSKKAHAVRSTIGKRLDINLTPAERRQFVALVNKIVAHP